MAASDPPAIIASASPRRMISNDSPMACADAEQAVHVARFGPLAPNRIETWPDARLMMAEGMKNGEIFLGPPVQQRAVLAFDRLESADPRSDEDADVRRVRFGDRQLGVVHRELRRRDGVLNEDVHLLDVFLLDVVERVESPYLGRDLCCVPGDIEPGDPIDAARPDDERFPVGLGPDAERRHQTDARDDDPPGQTPSVTSARPTSCSSRAPRCSQSLP